jgi:hypothetical protein
MLRRDDCGQHLTNGRKDDPDSPKRPLPFPQYPAFTPDIDVDIRATEPPFPDDSCAGSDSGMGLRSCMFR